MSDVLTRPRVCHYPHAAFTSGPEFTELAASAGLLLDPWQSFVLDCGLGERPDGKWASFQNTIVIPRQNGKDAIFEALGLGWLFLTGERLIGHSAHEYKTAMEAFRRLVSLIENSDDLRRKVKKIINTNGEEGIELLDGRRMRFLARSKGAGRGFSFDKVIWNEAYALTSPQVDAVLPTMSARPNPQLWLGSSPPLDPATGEALFRARRSAGLDGTMYLDWGLDGSLEDIGPCELGEDCTHQPGVLGCLLDDEAAWARVNPSYPHRIGPEAIRRERATMNPAGFARERLGMWPPDFAEGFTVISRSQWDRLEDTESGLPETTKALVGRPVFAARVSPRSKGPVRASIGLASRRADGLIHIEVALTGPGSVWVPGAMRTLQEKWNPAAIVIDPGSPAGSIIADTEAQGVEVTTMATRDVAQAFGMIYDAATSESAEARNVRHLGQSELTLAIRGATTRPVGDGHAWDSRTAATDITGIAACTDALWGLAKLGAVPEPVAPWVMYA